MAEYINFLKDIGDFLLNLIFEKQKKDNGWLFTNLYKISSHIIYPYSVTLIPTLFYILETFDPQRDKYITMKDSWGK